LEVFELLDSINKEPLGATFESYMLFEFTLDLPVRLYFVNGIERIKGTERNKRIPIMLRKMISSKDEKPEKCFILIELLFDILGCDR